MSTNKKLRKEPQEAAQAATEPASAQIAAEAGQDAHKTTEAQRKAVAAWVKGRDTITLRLTKADGAAIREAAKAAGVSVTRYILDRVRKVD